MKYLFSVFLLLISLACCAAIYIQIDKNGNAIFSDTPLGSHAKVVTLPEENQTSTQPQPSTLSVTTKAAQGEPQTTDNTTQKIPRKPYVQFDFASPVDQETIQNQPTIPVSMTVAPPLQEGDTIQIYLDGNPWGNAAPSTHFVFTAPYRGTHSLSAKLFDSDQHVLMQTPNITIYVHQAHIPNPPAS